MLCYSLLQILVINVIWAVPWIDTHMGHNLCKHMHTCTCVYVYIHKHANYLVAFFLHTLPEREGKKVNFITRFVTLL